MSPHRDMRGGTKNKKFSVCNCKVLLLSYAPEYTCKSPLNTHSAFFQHEVLNAEMQDLTNFLYNFMHLNTIFSN